MDESESCTRKYIGMIMNSCKYEWLLKWDKSIENE